jgi:hypothetical protein
VPKVIALLALAGCLAIDASAQGDVDLVPAAVAADIVQQTNAFREEHRGAPLTSAAALTEAAQAFADLMARTDRYGHEADGREPPERARQHGYDYCIVSENIAYRYRKPEFERRELAQSLVQGWEDSPVHRRNMLDPDVRDTGVGLARSRKTGRWYAVQMFGLPKDAQIRFQVVNETPRTIRYRLGERSFELGPRVTRTHLQCRDAEVSVGAPDQPSKTIHPRTGKRYEVHRDADGQWSVVEGTATG